MLATEFNPRKFSDYLHQFLLPLLAVFVPVLALALDLQLAPLIMTSSQRLFGLFSFCMWFVLCAAAFHEIKARPGISFEQGIVILLPLLVSAFLLVLIVEYGDVSWDYEQYENAYREILLGRNPYTSQQYLYPPLFAQSMAFIHSVGARFVGAGVISPWVFVYYIYQCVQFFLGMLAYKLSVRFASRIGLPEPAAAWIVAGLFLLNFPLVRTLHLNQVNLLILNSTLISLLILSRFPALSGVAVTLGGFVKLYPFILGAPLLVMKKWKALMGIFASGAIIVLVLTRFGQDWSLWRQFVEFMLSFPAERESSVWMRNTSILSLGRNLSRFAGLPESLVTPLYAAGALTVLAWIALRLYQRERTYATLPPGPAGERYRNYGSLIDFVSLSLLLTPSAWDHHFVLALPLALWAIALRRKDRAGWLAVAIACVFVMPPYDIFPFSYLRMFGVIALLILTSPRFRLELGGEAASTATS